MNNINISFTEIERDFLVQVVKLFEATSEIKVSELKNKIIANEKSFSENEVKLLYLFIRDLKTSIEKLLDNPNIKDENLQLNYKGCNHCLRKCRKALEESGISVSDLLCSYNHFCEDINEVFDFLM